MKMLFQTFSAWPKLSVAALCPSVVSCLLPKFGKFLSQTPPFTTPHSANPLACAAASACIEVLLDEHLPARSAVMGNYFMRKLSELQDKYPTLIADVRGKGLLIGLEFASQEVREAVQVELFYRGVLVAGTLNANRTFRIEPPLIITESQINIMIDTLESILVELADGEECQSPSVSRSRKNRKESKPVCERRLVPVKGAKVPENVKSGKSGSKKSGKKSKSKEKNKSKGKSAYRAKGRK